MKINLKQLADNYFYKNYPITQDEYSKLKSSPYKRIFESKPYDSKNMLVENFEVKRVRKNKVPHFHVGVEKFNIRDLVDLIESKFNLDLSHSLYNRYSKINIDELKSTIEEFKNKTLMNSETRNHIQQMLDKEVLHDILYILYSVEC